MYLSVMLKNSNKTSCVCDMIRTLPYDLEMALNLTSSRTYVISSTYWIYCLRKCTHKSDILCLKRSIWKGSIQKWTPRDGGCDLWTWICLYWLSPEFSLDRKASECSIIYTFLAFALKICSAVVDLSIWIPVLIWSGFKSNTSSISGRHPFNQPVHFHTCAGISPSTTCPSSLALCKDLGWAQVMHEMQF